MYEIVLFKFLRNYVSQAFPRFSDTDILFELTERLRLRQSTQDGDLLGELAPGLEELPLSISFCKPDNLLAFLRDPPGYGSEGVRFEGGSVHICANKIRSPALVERGVIREAVFGHRYGGSSFQEESVKLADAHHHACL